MFYLPLPQSSSEGLQSSLNSRPRRGKPRYSPCSTLNMDKITSDAIQTMPLITQTVCITRGVQWKPLSRPRGVHQRRDWGEGDELEIVRGDPGIERGRGGPSSAATPCRRRCNGEGQWSGRGRGCPRASLVTDRGRPPSLFFAVAASA